VALLAAACGGGSHPGSATSSTAGGTSTTTPGGGGKGNTASAPGVTAKTVTVANIATVGGPIPGLFKGALVGVQAFLAYQNSLGGVYGRTLSVKSGDDQLSCSTNKSLTQQLAPSVLAFVGSFSLYDNCGAAVIPGTQPNVSVGLNASVTAQPNTFSAQPQIPGWATGPLLYFKSKYPQAVLHVGALVGTIPSAEATWKYEQNAMNSVGYHVSIVDSYSYTQTQFTSAVIAMQQAGVQMVVMDQADPATIARFMKAMVLQGFHPTVVTSAGVAYTGSFMQQAGVQAASMLTNDQHQALYLGTDASVVPEVKTFDAWVQKTSPGFVPDIFTVFGWISAMLFIQALEKAGQNPTQASLMAALGQIHSFNANGLVATADPAGKVPATCYLIARVVNGQWQRVDSPKSGFICNGSFVKYNG
jgi:branched-chain amino acid transport system substrate-binding protein